MRTLHAHKIDSIAQQVSKPHSQTEAKNENMTSTDKQTGGNSNKKNGQQQYQVAVVVATAITSRACNQIEPSEPNLKIGLKSPTG